MTDTERLRERLEKEVYSIQVHRYRDEEDWTEAHVVRICAAIVEEFGLTKYLGEKWWKLARLPSDDWRDVCIAILDVAEGK
jgi:hypothetical protein